MTDDEIRFCYKCGASLPEGSDFCPECGASIRNNGTTQRTETAARPASGLKKDLGAIPILIMVYGILAIIGALLTLLVGASLETMIDTFREFVKEGVISQDEFDQLMSMLGLVDEAAIQAVKTKFITEGAILALSGILALVSANFCSKLQNFKAALTCCMVASGVTLFMMVFLDPTGIILAIVGFIISYLIYQKKDLFTS